MPISAASSRAGDLRRLIDRAVLGRQRARAPPSRAAASSVCSSVGARLDRQRVGIRLRGAVEVAARLEHLADLRERLGVAGIERRRLAEVLERRVGVALLPLDGGELAIQERAVGRAGDRRRVGRARLVEPAGARRLARAARVPARRCGTSAPRCAGASSVSDGSAASAASKRRRARRASRFSASSASPRPTSAETSSCCGFSSSARSKCAQRGLRSLRASST